MASLISKTGSNRKLVGDEEVLEWAFVLVSEWEGFFIPISRERERERERTSPRKFTSSLNNYFDIGEEYL